MRSLAALVIAVPSVAQAYSIGTSVTRPCHENITGQAIATATPFSLAPDEDPSAVWWRLSEQVADGLDAPPPRTAAERIVAVSAVLGVRRPDLGESGPIHLVALREVHLSEEHQVRHFLRRSDQDGEQGAADAAASARAYILSLLEASAVAFDADPRAEHLETVLVWVEDYGQIEVQVWMPLFLLAQALHALQDSFTHTYRSDDLSRIFTVENYVEASVPGLDETRDGPRHSDALDDCENPELVPIVERATAASSELIDATVDYWSTRERARIEEVLDRWTSIEPGCSMEAEYCGSRWVPIARSDETRPLFGCAVSPACPSPIAPLFGALLIVYVSRRTKRWTSSRRERRKSAR